MTTTPAAVPVRVYSKPAGCQQCTATKKHLDRQGTPYTTLDVTTDPIAFARVQELGYNGVPVIEVGDMHWQGFRPDRLNKLANMAVYAPDIAELDAEASAYLADDEAAALLDAS